MCLEAAIADELEEFLGSRGLVISRRWRVVSYFDEYRGCYCDVSISVCGGVVEAFFCVLTEPFDDTMALKADLSDPDFMEQLNESVWRYIKGSCGG